MEDGRPELRRKREEIGWLDIVEDGGETEARRSRRASGVEEIPIHGGRWACIALTQAATMECGCALVGGWGEREVAHLRGFLCSWEEANGKRLKC